MIRRTFFHVLALAIIAFAGQTVPAAERVASTSPKTVVNKGYRVEYRSPGTTAWKLAGNYSDKARADGVASSLYREGYEIRFTSVESVTVLRQTGSSPRPDPSPEPRPIPKSKPVKVPSSISVVNMAEAQSIFSRMRSQSDIAFRYPSDGCYARAHLMCQLLVGMGLQPGKAWVFDDEKKNRLVAVTPNHPRGYVQWWYHVAPILKIRDNAGKVRTHVIDPSMFDRPATIFAWQKKMYHSRVRFLGRLECTSLNQPPTDGKGKRFPGTGYWPGGDPTDVTAHARNMMAMYKPHQGTAWTPPRVATRAAAAGKPAELTSPFNPAAKPIDLGKDFSEK
jgi:hypothetical protein